MNDSIFNRLHESVSSLKMKIDTSELAAFADEQSFTPEQLDAICATFDYLKERKHDMFYVIIKYVQKLWNKNVHMISSISLERRLINDHQNQYHS